MIDRDGKLSLGNTLSEDTINLVGPPITLRIMCKRQGDSATVIFVASQGKTKISVQQSFPIESIRGGVSLLTSGPQQAAGTTAKHQFAFRDFSLDGNLVSLFDDRSFGPILWSQYTLHHNRLRLQAQLAPLQPQGTSAELWVADKSSGWQKISEQPMEGLSRTVTFTVDNWDSSRDQQYQVRLNWLGQEHQWAGTIRKEPQKSDPLKLACFSCDNGYLFPLPNMVAQVKRQNPDLLFFAGDQIYEGYGGFGVARNSETPNAMLDFMRKYYQFGWTWRELLRDRPSIILPDDHDVFQGNIWGHGGRALPEPETNTWTLGGYLMPGDWVAAVEKIHVGHLPDPAVDMTLPIGIKPYFTQLNYGGVGFAILEDRKFKTGPMSMPAAKRTAGEGAQLLGPEQEKFLESWANDWTGHSMKCALSQTIFCNSATHSGPPLNRAKYFFDSGAWPKAARNRVVRILGDCHALSIHGDQHLGILLRQGIEEFDDAGYSFMVPGTANGWPRAWWPGVPKGELPEPGQKFTGRFRDDAGNPLHVLAVGNPEPGSNKLLKTETDLMEIGYRKGSGYGIVEFDKQNQTARISLYRLGDQEEMFEGFPQTIQIGGKPN